MNRIQKIISLIILVGLIIWAASNIKTDFSEQKSVQLYKQALLDYQANNFQNAYFLFGKVPRASVLKSASIYRQGLCAQKLGDYKSATKRYGQLIRAAKNSELGLRGKYLKAQTYYLSKEYSRAQKDFKSILKKYPQSDYAIAANYYLGLMEVEKSPQDAVSYFKNYLQNSHDGRFSLACAKSLAKLDGSKDTNLLVAKAYIAAGDYKTAQIYLARTKVADSWAHLAINSAKLNNYGATKYFAEDGLKYYSKNTDEELIHKVIDTYLKTQQGKPLDYLVANFQSAKGYDYIAYKKCKDLNKTLQAPCFNTLYYKFPNGQFSAEALSQVFYSKVRVRDYKTAKKLGREHLRKFSTANSAPMVMYWMGKIHKGAEATSYYRAVLNSFPDDYYAYLANLKVGEVSKTSLDDNTLELQQIEFPNPKDAQFVSELAFVKDYELINDLYKDNKFIQSWLAYQRGNYSNSARLARDAMDELNPKPSIDDPRWKLVYPIHYYDEIEKSALGARNNPVLMLALVREESYFNPKAKSVVGASGLMQLMPATAKDVAKNFAFEFSNEILFNPKINIKLGNAYYAQLRNNLRGRNELAVLAYNGGAGSVTRWLTTINSYDTDDLIEQIPYDETKNYLKKVYKSYWNYKRIYR